MVFLSLFFFSEEEGRRCGKLFPNPQGIDVSSPRSFFNEEPCAETSLSPAEASLRPFPELRQRSLVPRIPLLRFGEVPSLLSFFMTPFPSCQKPPPFFFSVGFPRPPLLVSFSLSSWCIQYWGFCITQSFTTSPREKTFFFTKIVPSYFWREALSSTSPQEGSAHQ